MNNEVMKNDYFSIYVYSKNIDKLIYKFSFKFSYLVLVMFF